MTHGLLVTPSVKERLRVIEAEVSSIRREETSIFEERQQVLKRLRALEAAVAVDKRKGE